VSQPEAVALTTSDGVRIVADYWPGRGVAYAVAHGFTGSAQRAQVRRICTRLAATGAAVLAPDFRGHGRSGGFSTLGELEVRDLAAVVDSLRTRGHTAVAALGWSMGGSVVLRYAGLGGDADAVVSVSSPGHWWERGTKQMRQVHWAAETRAGRLATRLLLRTRLSKGWIELPESPVEVVGRIAPRPVLIVHGDADGYFPVRHAEVLAAAAPNAEFWLEAGMGHAESSTTPQLVDRLDGWVRTALGSTVREGLPL
jgi:uncharacterized protein